MPNRSTPFAHLSLRRAVHATITLTTIFLLSSCASVPKPTKTSEITPEIPNQSTPTVDDRPFDTDTLYSLLVAEFAGDRRRFDVMLSNYVQQAETTEDPGVVARAARLARYLNAHKTAMDMAQMWLKITPDNSEAHYIMLAELVYENRLLDALTHAEFLLNRGEISGFDAIGARAQQGGKIEITRQLLQRYQSLLTSHPNDVALNIGASLLYQHAGDLEPALKHAQAAKAQAPDDFQSSAQEARVLQQMGRTSEAMERFKELVAAHPENAHLRLQYARGLLKTDLALAEEQFATLLTAAPDDQDLTMTLALIEYERGQIERAQARFTSLTQSQSLKHKSGAHYYLGLIARDQKDHDVAIDHLSQVELGSDYLPAQAQMTELMTNQGEGKEAIALIVERRKTMPPNNPDITEGLYLLEAHLRSSQGNPNDALATLNQALIDHPKSNKLLFSRALLFTTLDKLDLAEQDFENLLQSTPENAAALNAWGYTLADRTDRLDEAYEYIRKAYSLTPEDPAVIDSMGWIEYRRGNIREAIIQLKRAMASMPDHEIAAHLGEVLWVDGQKDEARSVWQRGLKNSPESDLIRKTMKRLNATD